MTEPREDEEMLQVSTPQEKISVWRVIREALSSSPSKHCAMMSQLNSEERQLIQSLQKLDTPATRSIDSAIGGLVSEVGSDDATDK